MRRRRRTRRLLDESSRDKARPVCWFHAAPEHLLPPGRAAPDARRAQRLDPWRGGVGRRRARPVLVTRPHAAAVGPEQRPKPGARRAQRWCQWRGAVGRRRARPVMVWGLHAAAVGPGERRRAGRWKGTALGQWRGGVGRRRARPVLVTRTTRCGFGTWRAAQSRALEGHSAGSMARWCWPTARAPCPGSADHTLRLWDLASGAKPGARGHSGTVSLARWCWPTARAPCPGQRTGTLRLWDLASGKAGRSKGTRQVSWRGAVGRRRARPVLVTRTARCACGTWRAASSRALEGHSDGVYWRGGVGRRRARPVVVSGPHAAPVGPGERRRAGRSKGTAAGSLARWCWPTARAPCRGQGTARCACGTWRAATAGRSKGTATMVTGAVVLADGARALSWSCDRTLRLWDLASGQSRALEGHSARVHGAVVLADGARALSWSGDRTLRLWDLASGEQPGARRAQRRVSWRGGAGRRRARPVVVRATARCACGTWRAAAAGCSKGTAPRSLARWCWPTARAPCRGQRTARCGCGTWRAARAGRSKGTAVRGLLARWCWPTARAPCPGQGPHAAPVGPGERREPGARRA